MPICMSAAEWACLQIRNVGPADIDMLEGYAALNFAAGVTQKMKLGTMVTGVTYRYPGILITCCFRLSAEIARHGGTEGAGNG
jgi:hypothetical protein